MWTLEVLTKSIKTNDVLVRDSFSGFATRRDAEQKIMEYYDVQMSSDEIIYSFFLVSPWGTTFPVDIFGDAYRHMNLPGVPLIV